MYKGLKDGAKPDGKKEIVIDNKIREGWNSYVDWLEAKGLKGNPSLDKDDFGGQMIDKYKLENPDSPISREMIIPIQKDFIVYRDFVLEEVKNKKARLADGVTPETFMKDLSVVDGIAGQKTTKFKFPFKYLETYMGDKLEKKENKGFSVTEP
ncbi:MAG TPA: hypothetical protein PJ987_10545 [Bacteroidia bacterium]|nr:hypothetical protein [Bacteroidia bacterium]